MLPKFHCEPNPKKKILGRGQAIYNSIYKLHFPGITQEYSLGLDSITTENTKNYFRKARQYMFTYVEGFAVGPELEKQIKKYKKLYKPHRKVGVNE